MSRRVEITDLLWDEPVEVEAVVARLEEGGQRRAAKVVRRLPARGGRLDPAATAAMLLRVHRELQRLEEELQLPRRIAEWLAAALAPLGRPARVVDVGCGLGYVLRWLALHDALGPGVELVGVDLNGTLVSEASRLAAAEGLACRFVAGDAFAPGVAVADPERTVVISSGVLHHLEPHQLQDFFARQADLGVAAFAHWDVDPSGWASLGAWMFHRGRMREPVSRHDGLLSARRAYPAATLAAAAEAGAPAYSVSCAEGPRRRPVFAEVLRPVVGLRR